MTLKPWYQVVYPREDLRENRPLDAAEFAVHLDQVRDGRAPGDYQDPARFFARTYLTTSLTDLAGQVLRRLSGERTEASAVFNLSTQFGGGKTHALTLLYHLGRHGQAARDWQGVGRLLRRAGLEAIPQAATAVFVGTEFDSLRGRGGDDGTPLRRTPWGEIAYQLGGADALAILGEHEAQFIEPKGDVIREFLPKDRPALILVDEVINYVSTYRSLGYHNRMYNFLQSLSETARGQDNVVLVVSIPASELEYTAEDETDEQRFKKMLDRVGKAMMMSAETETAEIIRRRLFEWESPAVTQEGRIILNREARDTCRAYADWVMEHRLQLPSWFPADGANEAFLATYPFHPSVLSVFERKWQSLPRFQRTRGVLRLLALWVARAYQSGYRGAHKDPLLGIGAAPLDDPMFRSAVFEQLGEGRLEGAVTTDIVGRRESFAVRLDDEAVETIRRARLHRQAATAVFFESNGGQQRSSATAPEIRLAVAAPDLDIGNVETVLEGLRSSCYYLVVEGNSYRFSVTPNLNKLLADRRANIQDARITETVQAEVQRIFRAGRGIEWVPFPETSGEIADRPVLTLAVLSPDRTMQDPATLPLIDRMTREAGSSGRTFKSALLWAVAEDDDGLRTDARQLLAWEMIHEEHEAGQLRLDDLQERQLREDLGKARSRLGESVWRAYRNVVLLDKDNGLRVINLGLIHSSAASSIVELILRRLRQDGEVEDAISPNFLRRNWPAFTEWSTKGVRDAFFASPRLPRLADPTAIKDTIVSGVREGFLAYIGKAPHGRYDPFYFRVQLGAYDVELSEEMFVITKETAEAYVEQQQAAASRQSEEDVQTIRESAATGLESSADGAVHVLQPELPVEQDTLPQPASVVRRAASRLAWSGEVPAQKWMNFYTKVLSRFAIGGGLTLRVQVEAAPPGGVSEQKVEETRAALRELGLGDQVQTE
jgi:hypothetical protein